MPSIPSLCNKAVLDQEPLGPHSKLFKNNMLLIEILLIKKKKHLRALKRLKAFPTSTQLILEFVTGTSYNLGGR